MTSSYNLSFFSVTLLFAISHYTLPVISVARPRKLTWVQFNPPTSGNFDEEMFEAGGVEWYRKLIKFYVVSATVPGGMIPGKYGVSQRTAFLPYLGKEYHQKSGMQLLAFPLGTVTWLPISSGEVMPAKSQLIQGGVDPNKEEQYVCRFLINWDGRQLLLAGKYVQSQGQKCFAGLNHIELSSPTFELLTKNMLGDALDAYPAA